MNSPSAHHAIFSLFDGSISHMDIWVMIGLCGQSLFFMRFFIQWIASEKSRKSVIPEVFWYFSLGGGIILLAYAVHRQDPVFILGQAIGLLVYFRNIMLVWREKAEAAK
jgi:lipid-A-disaccharide synthase-like uncharacterized protein